MNIKISMFLALIVLVAGCDFKSHAGEVRVGFVAECQGDKEGVVLGVNSSGYGLSGGDAICADMAGSYLELERGVRFRAGKDGLNDLVLRCEYLPTLSFMERNKGRRILLLVNDSVLGAARVPSGDIVDPCVVHLGDDFARALEACEAVAGSMGYNGEDCGRPCEGDEDVCALIR